MSEIQKEDVLLKVLGREELTAAEREFVKAHIDRFLTHFQGDPDEEQFVAYLKNIRDS
ncbi:MAG: hypothetical protein KDK30_04085 [Leptospiraceae bacterium]|nr:hypothetical protein [Leptospiraceae bacterium]MCB1318158.1 hypothetical protein [Leptospiraceae bacterium]